MRPHVLLLALALAGCPKPAPEPVTPVQPSGELVCGVEEADHDEAADHVVNALQDQTGLDRWVAKYTRPVIVCVVEEIIVDAHAAPVITARAKAWLAEGGN